MVEISFNADNLDRKIRSELEDFFTEIAATLSNIIADEVPVGATGNLRNSVQVLGYNSRNGRAVVAVKANYAADVLQGQQPGTWPQFEPIKKWVRRVVGASEYQSWGGDDWEVNSLKEATYLVQRSVYAEGTDPNPYLERSLKRLKQKYG